MTSSVGLTADGTLDAAVSRGAPSRGDAEDLRTEVRGGFAIPAISGTAGALADVDSRCGTSVLLATELSTLRSPGAPHLAAMPKPYVPKCTVGHRGANATFAVTGVRKGRSCW